MDGPFVVVGGDAAGVSATSKAGREDPDREIVTFERGEYTSYAACGMSYYVKGDVATIEDLVQVTPDEFREERNIDVRTNHEVVDVDPDDRTVTVATALQGGQTVRELEYADLAYAPPFSPTWDPILTAARVLQGELEGVATPGSNGR